MTDTVADAPRAVISQRREFAIIIVLSLLAVSMIVVASATNSYVPLFFAWVPYLGIPLVVSRLDRARASAAPAPPVGGPVPPADIDAKPDARDSDAPEDVMDTEPRSDPTREDEDDR
ncbi:MAG: hypothetical protein ACJ76P_07060 [Actinomycetota bacterium]